MVTAKQIDFYSQGYQAFYQGVGLYAVDSELYRMGWLDAYAWEMEKYEREKGLGR